MIELSMSTALQTSRHDTALYEALVAFCSDGPTAIRRGKMFGCPALYVGCKLALCVYEDRIGMRVPEAVATRAKLAKRAGAFTPYGKNPMREWIAVTAAEDLAEFQDLIEAALRFAEQSDGTG